MGTNKITIRGDAKEVLRMFKEIDKASNKTQENIGKNTKKTNKDFFDMGQAMKSYMTIAGLKLGANLIKSSEKMSMALSILKLKNKDVAEQLENTEAATFGLANKFDMVTAANKALAFGIDLSDGRLNRLTKISTKLAMVMGIDVKQAFDDLIVSSARQQKLIADNLGIMIDKVAVDKAYAIQLGVVGRKLTEQEQSQAFLNEILKKGDVIVKELGDDFVKEGTKGTKALKQIETAAKSTLLVIADIFVGIGEGAAKLASGTSASVGFAQTELYKFNRGRIEAEAVTLEELKRLKELSANNDKKKRKEIINEYRQYYRELQKIEGAKEADMEDVGTLILAKNREKKEAINKEYFDAISKLNAEFNLGVQAGREVDFKDFSLTIGKKQLLVEKQLDLAKNTLISISKVASNAWKTIAWPFDQIEKNRALQAKKDADWWKKNKSRVMGERKAQAKAIIEFEKIKIDYNKLGYEEKLKADIKFAALEKALVQKRVYELKSIRMASAKDADVNRTIKQGWEKLWEDLNISAQKFLDGEKIRKDAIISATKETNSSLLDLARRNQDQLAQIKNIELKQNALRRKEELKQEQEFATSFVNIGFSMMQMIIEGNAKAIPLMLAQKAFLHGQELIIDGIKHVLKGSAELSGSFGLIGGTEVAAGYSEMAQGAAWAIGGGLGMVAFQDTANSSSGSDSAKTEGARDRLDTEKAIDKNTREDVQVFQYPSEQEYLQNLKRQNKKIKRGF